MSLTPFASGGLFVFIVKLLGICIEIGENYTENSTGNEGKNDDSLQVAKRCSHPFDTAWIFNKMMETMHFG